jgi:hypothetical protein
VVGVVAAAEGSSVWHSAQVFDHSSCSAIAVRTAVQSAAVRTGRIGAGKLTGIRPRSGSALRI